MTDQNWQAARRAKLWERLCRLSDELQELACLWWDEDQDMAGWEPDGGDEQTDDSSRAPRSQSQKPQRQ